MLIFFAKCNACSALIYVKRTHGLRFQDTFLVLMALFPFDTSSYLVNWVVSTWYVTSVKALRKSTWGFQVFCR